MDDRQPADFPAVLEKIHDAPRTQLGHREPRYVGDRLLVVERLSESAADLRQKKCTSLGSAPLHFTLGKSGTSLFPSHFVSRVKNCAFLTKIVCLLKIQHCSF